MAVPSACRPGTIPPSETGARSVGQNSRGRHDQQSEKDSCGKQHLRHLALPYARDVDGREKNNEQRCVQGGGQRAQVKNFRGIVAGKKRHHRDGAGLDDGQARPGVQKSGRETERPVEIMVISSGMRTGGHQLRVAQGADQGGQSARKPQQHQHPFAFGARGRDGRGLENAHAQHHAHDNGRRINHGKRLSGSGEFKHRDIPFSERSGRDQLISQIQNPALSDHSLHMLSDHDEFPHADPGVDVIFAAVNESPFGNLRERQGLLQDGENLSVALVDDGREPSQAQQGHRIFFLPKARRLLLVAQNPHPVKKVMIPEHPVASSPLAWRGRPTPGRTPFSIRFA